MNKAKLMAANQAYVENKKLKADYYEENWAERKERKEYYQSFNKAKLL